MIFKVAVSFLQMFSDLTGTQLLQTLPLYSSFVLSKLGGNHEFRKLQLPKCIYNKTRENVLTVGLSAIGAQLKENKFQYLWYDNCLIYKDGRMSNYITSYRIVFQVSTHRVVSVRRS